MELSEAIEILGRHVLSMLDAEATVAGTVGFFDFRVQIQHHGNCLVANRVHRDLQAGGVGPHHALAHGRKRLHLGPQ